MYVWALYGHATITELKVYMGHAGHNVYTGHAGHNGLNGHGSPRLAVEAGSHG